jgi:hypothetical protein
MSANQLRIEGLTELRAALKALPPELVRESGVIVHAQAEAAAREIAGAYPVHTGNLRDHLRVEIHGDAVSASAKIRNTAKHAWIFERGTDQRRWRNGSTTAPFRKKGTAPVPNWGAGKNTGRMPVGRVFIPIAMQRRRIMLAALIDLVERSGLHVSGAAG